MGGGATYASGMDFHRRGSAPRFKMEDISGTATMGWAQGVLFLLALQLERV